MPGSAGVPPANKNKKSDSHPSSPYKGWHSRGYLPHFDAGEVSQFITFRIVASLPTELLHSWRSALEYLPPTDADIEMKNRIEEHLDKNAGHTWLKNPEIATIVQNSMLYFDAQRYRLNSWVVMPNHVHMLLTVISGHGVPGIMHSIKSFTAKEANRVLERDGAFWQMDYFDRFIRTEEHYLRPIEYIEMNPVNAGLCERREKWKFSSAAKE